MTTTLFPHLIAWAVLTTLVVFLAIYRKRIGSGADETLHVLDAEVGAVTDQITVAKKLVVVDRWGKILTILAALYLLGIAAMYIYSVLQDQSVKMS
jgi:hypothetical protein